jgi:LmbE family N-acetylglucosaminyl deacetylase
MPRLLCFTAHPDDEAGNFGGSLLHYAASGVETHVVCLTPGQAATHRGGAKSEEELCAMRRQEFARSCELLRVTGSAVLDYPDGKLDREDLFAVVGDLTRCIREVRPHVVVTTGPEGGITAHPDHAVVSVFTTLAFHWAARSDRYAGQLHPTARTPSAAGDGLKVHQAQKLYYASALFTLPGRPQVSLAPVTTTIELAAPELEGKIAAFRCHLSQAPLFERFEAIMRKRSRQEVFHLAASSTPHRADRETDLFAGIKE